MLFRVNVRGNKGARHLIYDTQLHSLTWEDTKEVVLPDHIDLPKPYKKFCISLGLACNYSCSYCLQAHEKLKPIDSIRLQKLFSEMDSKDLKEYKVEFWGGEPLLYKDTILKIAERYKGKVGMFSMITNGSLLTKELVDKLVGEYKIQITVSHDGPAQDKRKKDPLDTNFEALNYLFSKYPEYSSVHSVLSLDNYESKERANWFKNKLGMSVEQGSEGFIVDYAGKDGFKIDILNKVYEDLALGTGLQNAYYASKMLFFFKSLLNKTNLASITTKCGVDKDTYTVFNLSDDTKMTCHDFRGELPINTIRDREKCLECPVVHLCKGGCPVISSNSKAFENNCNTDFQVNMAVLRVCIEILLDGKYAVERIERL